MTRESDSTLCEEDCERAGPISAVDAANPKRGIWGGLEKRSEEGVEEDVWGISKGDLGGD